MAEPVRVFVSHHHSPTEDAFTARLVADLDAAGADVWVDTSGIQSDDFVRQISEGLEGRQWLVLVMTPDALRSPWVQREVNAALAEHTVGRMLGVVPVLARPCKDTEIPVLWRPLHRYDATADYKGALGKLLHVLALATPSPPSQAMSRNVQSSGDIASATVAAPAQPLTTQHGSLKVVGAPRLFITPLRVDVGIIDPGETPTVTLEVANRGTGLLSGYVEVNHASLQPVVDVVRTDTRTLQIRIDTTALVPGIYICHVAVRTNGGDQIVPVRFIVRDE